MQVQDNIQQYTPAQLADVCRVYAKLNLAPEGLYECIAQQTVACMADADTQDLLRYSPPGCDPIAILLCPMQLHCCSTPTFPPQHPPMQPLPSRDIRFGVKSSTELLSVHVCACCIMQDPHCL